MPKVTVLMPVRNSAEFLTRSIQSILEQGFRDYELLIINDGSNDNSVEIVKSFFDQRIRLIHNPHHLGVALTLNRGLEIARGTYIARMDADDKAHPERLAKQVAYLEKNTETGILGTWIRLFGDQPGVIERKPVGHEAVRAGLVFDNTLFHPTVMLRKSVLERNSLRYDTAFDRAEDYELWSRAAECCRIDNLPIVLLNMRIHGGSITTTKQETMTRQTLEILKGHLKRIGILVNDEGTRFHHHIGRGRRMRCLNEINHAEIWIKTVVKAGIDSGIYCLKGMALAAGMVWFRLCRNSSNLGIEIWHAWRKSPLSKGYVPALDEYRRWLLSIIWHMLRHKKICYHDKHA